MSRAARLQSARHWLAGYRGTRVVRSYARWFGVDLVCAARELRTLGVQVSAEYLERLRITPSQPRRRRPTGGEPERSATWVEPLSDARFAYIAGSTPAGLPFGVTWEQLQDTRNDQVAFAQGNDEPLLEDEDEFLVNGNGDDPF